MLNYLETNNQNQKNMNSLTIKYYNNRPVLLLREEADGTWFVSATLDLSHDITGSNFCMQCNIGGGDYKGSHTCDDANEIIDHVMENISDHEVFWVQPQYLRDEPFEKKPFDALVLEIEKLVSVKTQLETDRDGIKSDINDAKNELSELSTRISDLQQKVVFAQNELLNTALQPIEIPKYISVGSKTISASMFIEVVKNHLMMQDLIVGGVDNWEWYSESLKSDDYESDAINFLTSL